MTAVFEMTELGMRLTCPYASTTQVERQLMSATVPVKSPNLITSPGLITLLVMSARPPTMFDMVSCRPSESATPPMPSVASRAPASMPKQEERTSEMPVAHTATRTMISMIEHEGRGTPSMESRRRATRTSSHDARLVTARISTPHGYSIYR